VGRGFSVLGMARMPMPRFHWGRDASNRMEDVKTIACCRLVPHRAAILR
jgi:hypothetical protein